MFHFSFRAAVDCGIHIVSVRSCLQGVYDKWCQVLDTVPEREAAFEAELQKQQENEQLRVEFGEKANTVGAYIETKQAALADLSMQGLGTMEVCAIKEEKK